MGITSAGSSGGNFRSPFGHQRGVLTNLLAQAARGVTSARQGEWIPQGRATAPAGLAGGFSLVGEPLNGRANLPHSASHLLPRLLPGSMMSTKLNRIRR